MKVVKASEMARIERLAYASGAKEETFMNQAGKAIADHVEQYIIKHHLQPSLILLCGSGNNAGDAYTAGTLLLKKGMTVKAVAITDLEESSPLCKLQSKRFIEAGGDIQVIKNEGRIELGNALLLVDGLLGTGFHGELKGVMKHIIKEANASYLPIISIDIPSGIDGTSGRVGGIAIKADETLFLGLPKSGCFFKEAWEYVGKTHVYDFGLGSFYINQADEDFILIDDALIKQYFPKIKRTRHKYEAGYVVGIGGCEGMPGAPLMSSMAALRSGAGIVRLLHPEGMEAELSSAPLEIIRQGYRDGFGKNILECAKKAAALFIGPGMGHSSSALRTLKRVLPHLNRPCVIDADALTLLSEHPMALPPQIVMTPHHGEMKRLLNIQQEISFHELFEMTRIYAFHNKITLVLKGSPTFIFHPNSKPFVCSRGDPGMATAGSGDVLTGMIAAFLAQTHDPLKAAILGVQLHAIAGECAAQQLTSYCMTATDIINSLPSAFKHVLKS